MISIRPKHLKRYQTVAWLLIKHGRSEMVKKSGLADLIEGYDGMMGRTNEAKAEDLVTDLEANGPTFIKLGQLLSTRVDLLPPEYITALTRLQDQVAPVEFVKIAELIENSLGKPLSQLFAHIEKTPLATASLSQVHRATSHEGEQLVVKVRRPEIEAVIIDDLDAFEDLASLLEDHLELGRQFGFRQIVTTFRQAILNELNFSVEKDNLNRLARSLEPFERLITPRAYDKLSSDSILTMEYIAGKKIPSSSLSDLDPALRKALAHQLFCSYLKQIFEDGFFHGDPHPGNLLFTEDQKIAILDLGMTIHLTPGKQENLIKLLLAIAEGHGELAADVTVSMGFARADFQGERFKAKVSQLIGENYNAGLDRLNVGRLILDLNLLAGRSGFQLPSELIAISKVLLNLEKTMSSLDESFHLAQAIKAESYRLLKNRLTPDASLAHLYNTLSESKDFASSLPYRLNRILELLSGNRMKFEVNAVDEYMLITGFQKIANRITTGLLLGSLILGASVSMHVETSFVLLGYPAISLVLFLLAAIGAIALAFNIIFRDR